MQFFERAKRFLAFELPIMQRKEAVDVPTQYLTAHAPQMQDDRILGFDQFARSAIETYRSSYCPLPTSQTREFAAFFNQKNYELLYDEVKRRSGNKPDASELYETMMAAFQMVRPRSDDMDERSADFSPAVTRSYVDEMNKYVLEHAVEDVKAANQLWAHYAKYRHGPDYAEFLEDDAMHFGIDTRTNAQGSLYDGTYLLPS